MIATARKLAKASPQKPRQADLKRAVSTAYYALFHAMAKDAADMLVGVGPSRQGLDANVSRPSARRRQECVHDGAKSRLSRDNCCVC